MGLRTRPTPRRRLARGLVAGTAGAVAMDSLQYARYRLGGGEDPVLAWEFTVPVTDWEQAPATARIGKLIWEGIVRRPLPVQRAALTNTVVHWGYCMVWGGAFALVERSAGAPKARHGLALGTTVWLASYVIMPLAGLYRPIWKYDVPVLAKDLSDHLAYGLGVSTAHRLLAGGSTAGRRG